MVFFINIYGRAADPPDKDKGNQNDMVNNNSRYLRASNVLRKPSQFSFTVDWLLSAHLMEGEGVFGCIGRPNTKLSTIE